MRTLGLDYGQRHLGLAIAEEGGLPEPLPSVSFGSEGEALSRLREVVETWAPHQVVLGLPEGRLVEEVKRFAANLESHLHLPVILHPETLSSKEALERLRQVGASRKKLKDEHSYAACLILEDYLDQV